MESSSSHTDQAILQMWYSLAWDRGLKKKNGIGKSTPYYKLCDGKIPINPDQIFFGFMIVIAEFFLIKSNPKLKDLN